jgi:integrase
VCALLARYRDRQTAGGYTGQHLFPTRNGKGMTESQAAVIFSQLGRGEWTSHDLRKLARTGWADLGIDFLIGEMLINHAMGKTVQAYIHTTVEERKRAALETWHAHLDLKGFAAIHGLEGGENEDSTNTPEAAPHKGCEAINESTIGEVLKC